MVPVRAWRRLSGIRFTQVGDPLPHRQKGLLHCISSDRSLLAVAESVDKQVADFVITVGDITEGRGFPDTGTEVGPVDEGGRLGPAGLGSDTPGGHLERSAQISLEIVSCPRCSCRQGLGCGYTCSKWRRRALSVRCCRREVSSAIAFAGPEMWEEM